MSIDPADNAGVTARLLTYLRLRLSPAVEFAQPPEPLGRGFDTFIYRFKVRDGSLDATWLQPLVLRIYSSLDQVEKAQREAAVQEFVAHRGYPALKPLATEVSDEGIGLPFMIMRRVEGGTLLDAITKRPWRARRLLAGMADLHVRLHQLPVDGCPLTRERPLVDIKLEDARELIDKMNASHMEEGFRWIEERKQFVLDEDPVLCHNDFHPLNILLEADGETMAVIDWPDAALGDRHCDVARTVALIWFAQVAADSAFERFLLKAARGFLRGSYFNRYEALLPVEKRRLEYWEALHTFVGWAQLEDVAYRAAQGEHQTGMAQQIPPGTTALARDRFWKLARNFG
jgi:aminoglycoside phosphotransferase (APT) family kinase protein